MFLTWGCPLAFPREFLLTLRTTLVGTHIINLRCDLNTGGFDFSDDFNLPAEAENLH